MKITFNITAFCLACFALLSCEKYADDYKSFLDNREIVYPGVARNVGYQAGNRRTKLYWNPSPDPTITKYVIKWNNGSDSLIVDSPTTNPAEKVTAIVSGLEEYVYSFVITSYDAAGNKSIPIEINNVRVYGDAYRASLFNRTYNTLNPYEVNPDRSVVLNFNAADTMNVATAIMYTNNQNQPTEANILPGQSSIILPDYKFGTPLKYKSSYRPEEASIDIFYTTTEITFPMIIGYFECDKSLFQALYLPTDVTSAYGWLLPYLWDNRLEEGRGFHTPGKAMPMWFTFDIGQEVNLGRFKIWQRMSSVYNAGNPKKWEVYATNNTPDPSGSWSGWTKLMDCTSVKPSGLPQGQTSAADVSYASKGELFDFPTGLPKVRYIRFKILETWGGANYFHAMELTFLEKK